MSLIEAKNIDVFYGQGDAKTHALCQVNLKVQEGEFVALVGPSGSGKSTLLAVLGTLLVPQTGILTVDEIDVYALNEERRADFRREYIGFIFQQFHLLPYLTALENVMLPLMLANLSRQEQRIQGLEALAKVGLADKAARLPNQLSGGEQERVAIARAVVNRPPLLLADEPTGALDSANGLRIMELLSKLNDHGQTIAMVTHNPEYEQYAHRVVQIRDGRIASEGERA